MDIMRSRMAAYVFMGLPSTSLGNTTNLMVGFQWGFPSLWMKNSNFRPLEVNSRTNQPTIIGHLYFHTLGG
jgi:hypothetical protein